MTAAYGTRCGAFVWLILLQLAAQMLISEGQMYRIESLDDPKFRIFDGEKVTYEFRFPYMASLRDSMGHHNCFAVLIDPWWLLTAAHCVDPTMPDSLSPNPAYIVGDQNIQRRDDKTNDEEFTVERTCIHPNYTSGAGEGSGFDLALLKLPHASNKPPIPLPDPTFQVHTDEYFLALGGGMEEHMMSSVILNMASVRVKDFEECNADWGGSLQPHMICFHTPPDTCDGDSGGPLIRPNALDREIGKGSAKLDLLVAITSFGTKDCTMGTKPGVYINVSSFIEWINKVINSDPLDTITCPSNEQETPTQQPDYNKELMQAALENNATGIERLIELGANVSTKNNRYSEPPLHLAAKKGNLNALKVLLKYGAEIEEKDGHGRTALHLASSSPHVEIVEALIESGADVNARNSYRETPLHRASRKSRVTIVKVLLKNGANKEVKDTWGKTPKECIGLVKPASPKIHGEMNALLG